MPYVAGIDVVLRPIRPDDKAGLVAGLAHLSPEAVHARFMSPKPRFKASELRYLTEVDGHDHVAIVAALAVNPKVIVGVARFVRELDDPTRAEAAIVVSDVLHGHGLGTMLADALAAEAARHGVRAFTAVMLPSNVAARRLFRRLSTRLTEEVHDGVRELVAELPAAA